MGNPFPTIFGGGLDRKYNTIADELKSRDYSTHFIGKWGIDYPDPHPRDPNRTELVVVLIIPSLSFDNCVNAYYVLHRNR